MAKHLEIAELPGAPAACPAPAPATDHRSRRLRSDFEARSVAPRPQASCRPDGEVPLGDVLAPPVVEPAIESAGSQPPVVIGQCGTVAADKAERSLLHKFIAVLAIGTEDGQAREAEDERIIGSSDRAHHLALVAGTSQPQPTPARPARMPLLTRAARKSRADCQRRCGKDGFCDPSSALGCGGVHCGNALLREGL